MRNIILTGGGTAGHVIPNIALLDKLKEAGFAVHYIGSRDGIERGLMQGRPNVKYHPISSGKIRRYFDVKNLTDPFRVMAGVLQSFNIIRRVAPSVVFSKGGFVSVPVVIAAWMLQIPVVIHESDITPGLANKISRPFARVMCTTFSQAALAAGRKGVTTGSPVRPEVMNGDRYRGLVMSGFENGRPVLLVMGGSSGSQAINHAVDMDLDALRRKYQVIHIRGKNDIQAHMEGVPGYKQFGYIDEELPHILAAADVVISRAGANAIFELAALKKPMLLIPLPLSASRGDQILNAEYFKTRGWAKVLDQADMERIGLMPALAELERDRDKLVANLEKSNLSSGLDKLFAQIMKAALKH